MADVEHRQTDTGRLIIVQAGGGVLAVSAVVQVSWAWRKSALALLAASLVGCGTPPRQPAPAEVAPRRPASALPPPPQPLTIENAGTDGVGASPPSDLLLLPDAQPRLEAQRVGGPNKAYSVAGLVYVPQTGDPPLAERGLASWYGRKFHGRPTASGEIYDMYAMTAAHKTMPLPSYARVRNPSNDREVIVRINDRGPFHSDRVIDLSYAAALKLGLLGGVAPVEVERITEAAIRAESWRRPTSPQNLADAAADDDPIGDPIGEIARGLVSSAAAPMGGTGIELPARHSATGFWLQFGSFASAEAARTLRLRLGSENDWLAPLLAVFNDRKLHLVQAGPFADREKANSALLRLGSLISATPLIVEKKKSNPGPRRKNARAE
jgi:rare lipoprotein A